MTAASHLLGLARWGHRAHQHPRVSLGALGARRPHGSSPARSLEAEAGDPPLTAMEGGCSKGGPRPHLLLCKELRAPQCTVRLSAVLLTLSGSQSVPPTPVSSVPGPCPSWAGRGGAGAGMGGRARTRAGGRLGPGPQRTEVQPLTVPSAGQAAHSKKPRLSRQHPLCGRPGCQRGLILG